MSQMRRDRSGVWACPDDIRGRDRVTLDEGNAMGAQETTGPKVIAPTGDFDRSGHHDKDNPESILGILATPARSEGEVERVSNFPLMTGWWTMRGVRTSDTAVEIEGLTAIRKTGVGQWLNEARTTEAHLEDETALNQGNLRGPEDVFTTRISTRQDPFGQGTGNGNMHKGFTFLPEWDGEKIIGLPAVPESGSTGLRSSLSKLLPRGVGSEGLAGSHPCFWVAMRLTNLDPSVNDLGTAVAFHQAKDLDLDRAFGLTTAVDDRNDLTLVADYNPGVGTDRIAVPLLDIGSDLRLFSGRMERGHLVFKISNREFTLDRSISDSGHAFSVNFVTSMNDLECEMHEIVFTTNVPNDAQIARLERYFQLKFPTMATEFDNGI